MKKLTLYCDLRHECSGYWTKAIDVEKIVELNPTEFYRLKRETLKDNPCVKIYRDLTWSAGDTAQCVLFLEADGKNGIQSGVHHLVNNELLFFHLRCHNVLAVVDLKIIIYIYQLLFVSILQNVGAVFLIQMSIF